MKVIFYCCTEFDSGMKSSGTLRGIAVCYCLLLTIKWRKDENNLKDSAMLLLISIQPENIQKPSE